jgi:chemotaxis protein MotB
MSIKRAATGALIPLLGVMLSACVSSSEYDALAAKNQRLESELAALHQENEGEVVTLQQQHQWVEAADLMFPAGGWQLSPSGIEELNEIIPSLRNLTDTKITVYGYTDNSPVGQSLVSQGIANNMDLSTKRAGAVVAYLASKGVDPNIMSAKGRGDTHPVAPNDTPEGRAQNRRIELILEGPGVSP